MERHVHEHSDVPLGYIKKFFIYLVVGGLIVWAILAGFWRVLEQGAAMRAGTNPLAPPREFPPGPRLQIDPRADLHTYVQQQQKKLSAYGWVDKAKGVTHIPIEDAMNLVLQRGLPARAPEIKQEVIRNAPRTQ